MRWLSAAVAIASVGATFGLATQASAVTTRGVLWRVIQTCVLNHTLTGGAFPCLEANLSDGADRGYVVLRPFGSSDLILAPTRRIVGVEDRFLRTPDAPNYFEDAWQARKFLGDSRGSYRSQSGVALAVNSRQSRTQDQLHIHIGCLSPAATQTIETLAPALPTDRWAPVGRPFHGPELWGRLLIGDTLASANPFHLIVDGWSNPAPPPDRSQLAITIVRIEPSRGRKGFAMLASYSNPFGRHSVEDFLGGSNCQ